MTAVGTLAALAAHGVQMRAAFRMRDASLRSAMARYAAFAAAGAGDALRRDAWTPAPHDESHGAAVRAAAAAYAERALLPPVTPEFTAALAGGPAAGAAAGRLNARYVALRVRAGGAVLWASPNWAGPEAAASPYRATRALARATMDSEVDAVEVDAVVLPALAAAALDDDGTAHLTRGSLVAVVALAGVLAGGALLTARRQRALMLARERFVADVSHELRTPLAQIRMFSELLGTGPARSPEQTARWLGVINREAVRLGGLVENMLLYARGEAAGFRVTPRPEDAAELAREAVAAFAPIAAGRRAAVHVTGPDRAPLWADADAVRQLLGNLLDNAVKYGPEGQTVTVRVEPRPGLVSGRRGIRAGSLAGGAVALLVDDEGPGVAPADRARVWRPFERLDADDGTAGGSGLGLGVVRELAERQGGYAWVEDAPGGGARFGVLLPARAPTGGSV